MFQPGEKLCPTRKIKADQKKEEPTDSNENASDSHDLIDIATNVQELNSYFMEADVIQSNCMELVGTDKFLMRKGSCLSFIRNKKNTNSGPRKDGKHFGRNTKEVECTHQNVIAQKRIPQNSDDLEKLVQMMKEKIQNSPAKLKSKF